VAYEFRIPAKNAQYLPVKKIQQNTNYNGNAGTERYNLHNELWNFSVSFLANYIAYHSAAGSCKCPGAYAKQSKNIPHGV